MNSVCLAVLNYNGIHHLEALLPSMEAACQQSPMPASMVVLDNQSTKDDVAWIKRGFPTVETIVAPKNNFLFSYNWLAENRKEDILVLLNNDLVLRPDFIRPLVRHFIHNDVFAVSATSRDWDDKFFTCGPARLKSHHGVYEWAYQPENQELQHTLFASGGFMAVDRRKFLELGGFNHLLWPGYVEDLDLCFRAWRKGWRSIFEPKSVVLHRENGTWGSGTDGRAARLMFRGSLLFQWSSLPGAANWLERTSFICLTALRKQLKGQSWWPKVWLRTWMDWQKIRRQHSALMTSAEQLKTICSRIEEPVLEPRA